MIWSWSSPDWLQFCRLFQNAASRVDNNLVLSWKLTFLSSSMELPCNVLSENFCWGWSWRCQARVNQVLEMLLTSVIVNASRQISVVCLVKKMQYLHYFPAVLRWVRHTACAFFGCYECRKFPRRLCNVISESFEICNKQFSSACVVILFTSCRAAQFYKLDDARW